MNMWAIWGAIIGVQLLLWVVIIQLDRLIRSISKKEARE
jgi:hypothetical protein